VKTDPGVTKTRSRSSHLPISGTASFYYSTAKGANAYFDTSTAKGGVNGRKIKYTVWTTRTHRPTLGKARELVQQDKVS